MKPGVKIALGVFTAILTMGFVVVYDIYIKDKIDTVSVVVVKAGNEIQKNEEITPEKLSVELRDKSSLIDGVITANRMKDIIGVEAANTLVGNSMISEKMLNRDSLIPNEKKGEAIRPIKADWIYAKPGSLRREDSINIYVVKDVNVNSSSAEMSSNNAGAQNDIKGPVLENVKVIYAKDQSNKEVVGDKNVVGSEKRLDGTAQISDIEVILNEDDFNSLMDYVIKKGYKLYITYH